MVLVLKVEEGRETCGWLLRFKFVVVGGIFKTLSVRLHVSWLVSYHKGKLVRIERWLFLTKNGPIRSFLLAPSLG